MNIDIAKHMLKSYSGMTHKMTDNNGRPKLDQAIETILNELEKKEKIMQEVINYTYQEIEYYDEDIADYIDDDRNENKNIIDNLKEDREHWKDILKIIEKVEG